MVQNEPMTGKTLNDLLEKVRICNKFVEEHPNFATRTQSIVCGAMNCDRVTPRQLKKILRTVRNH